MKSLKSDKIVIANNLISRRMAALTEQMTTEDHERIQGLIKKKQFEIVKAEQAFSAHLIAFNPRINPATFEEAKAAKSAYLSTIVKYKGEDKAINLVYLMLVKFVSKFGRRNDMDDDLLFELASEIVLKFKGFSITQIKMVFNKLMREKMFNLDYSTILNFFHQQYDARLDYGAKVSAEKHRAFASQPRSRESDLSLLKDTSIEAQRLIMKVLTKEK